MALDYEALFGLRGKTVLITGGAGGLGREFTEIMAHAGARVIVIGRSDKTLEYATQLGSGGLDVLGFQADCTIRDSLIALNNQFEEQQLFPEILVNCAGGNRPAAVTSPELSFFDLDAEAVNDVLRLNFHAAFFASQIFGRAMARAGRGTIINIGSMAAVRPISRVVGYAAAKAAVSNFTQWLAVYMAREVCPQIRVNAIVPGFFLTEQNHKLLFDEESLQFTARAQSIIAQTPMGRLGQPSELSSALLWLASPSASFVTGALIPVDGGFSAFGGI